MKSTLSIWCCLLAVLALRSAAGFQSTADRDPFPPSVPQQIPAEAAPRQLDADAPLAPVATERARSAAAELVAQIFTPLPETTSAESPAKRLLLADVLPVGAGIDPERQIAAAHAYWDLAARSAERRIRYDSLARSEELIGQGKATSPPASPRVAALLAAQRARLEEAELELLKARNAISQAASTISAETPVVTADLPHAGAYRTYFQEIYAARAPSSEVRLIVRALPLHEQAIVSRASAAEAENDVYESAQDQYTAGQATLESVLESSAARTRALLELVAAVRAYNRDIASYAFVSVRPGLDRETLVGMLVKSGPIAAESAAIQPPAKASTPSGVERANFEQNLPAKQPAPSAAESQAAATGLYSAVSGAAATEQAQAIASVLHGDRGLPRDAGSAISLADCLRGVPPERRFLVLEAYWSARAAAARYLADSQSAEQLKSLAPAALQVRSAPGGPEVMLKLRAARLSAEARLVESHREFLTSCGRLSELAGRRGNDEFLLPSTPPTAAHRAPGGKTSDSLGSAPQTTDDSPLVAKSLHVVEGYASAVVAADEARVAAAENFSAGQSGVEDVLRAIQEESSETAAFLSALAAYNRDIALEAMHTLPREASVDTLISALGVTGVETTR